MRISLSRAWVRRVFSILHALLVSGWWFVNVEDHQGWVPSTYLKRKDGATDKNTQRARQGEGGEMCCQVDSKKELLSSHSSDNGFYEYWKEKSETFTEF